jgi:hypothetical protein
MHRIDGVRQVSVGWVNIKGIELPHIGGSQDTSIRRMRRSLLCLRRSPRQRRVCR